MYAFIHNDIVAADKAFLHIKDLSIQRGYGIFDFFKVSGEHVFFLEDYLDRFYHSAQVMKLPVPLDRESLKNAIHQLIRRNAMGESGVKMILTGGYSDDGYNPGPPNLIMTQHPLVLPGPEVAAAGVKIITHEYVREMPYAKTINYTMGIWLIDRVKEAKAYDVLYHRSGVVTEFPRCNFFIVTQENVVVTPDKNVLSGITRKNILKLAGRSYKTEERAVTLQDIREAKEAFLTSTTKRVVPIVDMDGSEIGNGKPGEVTLKLLSALTDLEKKDIQQSHIQVTH